MSAGEGVVAGAGLAQVSDQPASGVKLLAAPRSDYELFGNPNVQHSDARASRERHQPIIEIDEAFFNLLLRRRDDRMTEALAQLHRSEGDYLQRLARAGGLLDQHMA